VIQLKQLDPYEKFTWNWLPAKDTAGGILVGINSDMFEVLRCDTFDYTVSTLLKVKKLMLFGDSFLFMVLLMKNW
jgi:hypothetical protein